MAVKFKEIKTTNEFIDAIRLRTDVFIIEQHFPPGWEPDEEDKTAKQFIALSNNRVVATARFRETKKGEIKIERVATKKEFRHKGIAKALLKFMLKKILKLKPKIIFLYSQEPIQKLYSECGFKTASEPFDFNGILHIKMELEPKK